MNMDRKVSPALVMLEQGQRIATIARKLRMSEKTIRKYRDEKKLPSQMERPARERLFHPSAEALEQALTSGIKPTAHTGIWRARADGFLSSFQKRWIFGQPGAQVLL